jgi:hypothetical protein
MDRRAVKLKHKLGDADLAIVLVEAGLGTPKKIKKLSRSALEKRIGKSRAAKVRGKIK